MYVVTEALQNAQILTGCQNPAFEWSLLNMQLTFDPQDFEAGCLNKAWNKLVKWLSGNHF